MENSEETSDTSAEEGVKLTPKWNADGLISAIALDYQSREVLMLAHMNEAALNLTLTTGEVVYWSRSRKALWRKGETSGHRQKLMEMRIDCDQDAVVMLVEQLGPACHTGRGSCFYRRVEAGVRGAPARLVFIDHP